MPPDVLSKTIVLAKSTPEAGKPIYVTIGAMVATEIQRAKLLEGRPVDDAIKREVSAEVQRLKDVHGITPRLAAVLVGEDPASAVYVRNKVRACEEVGIASDKIALSAATT